MEIRYSRGASSIVLIAIETLAVALSVSCASSPEVSGPPSGSSGDPAAAPVVRAGSASSPAAPPFTVFESGQVRPLAMSPSKQFLFAVNTPDNRLEIFRITEDRLIRIGSIPRSGW
jgi:hypothetical protein